MRFKVKLFQNIIFLIFFSNMICEISYYENALDIIKTKSDSFYFLLPIIRESIVSGSNFRNVDFNGFTCFEVP